jgi:hypothetical protein
MSSNPKSNFTFPSSLQKWTVQNLDYNWYFAFSIFGGFFGLDYMYIGSPVMAILKTIVNLSTFGFWWYFDIINAAVAQDQIRLYGPSAPAFGPTGIGGGRFRDPKHPSGSKEILDKHLNFLLFGFSTLFGGIIGMDYFIVGEIFAAFMNLLATISIIGLPLSGLWQLYKCYRYFFDTNETINLNWNYLGAPKPNGGNDCPSFLMSITIWFLKTTVAILRMIPVVGSIAGLIQPLIDNLEVAYGMVVKTVETLVEVKQESEKIVAAEKNRPVPSKQELDVKAPVKSLEKPQTGGASAGDDDIGLLGPFFALTIGLIIVSSIVLSLRRSTQNGPKTVVKQPGSEESDDPPLPANPGVSSPVH